MKAYSMIKKRWLFILGLMFMVLPFSVNALEEEPRYEASLKFYKVDEEWKENFYGEETTWVDSVYLNDLEEELTESSVINPGDYLIIAPLVKLIDGKEPNAVNFNLFIKYDDKVLNYIDYDTNVKPHRYKGPFPGSNRSTSWQKVISGYDNSKLSFVFKDSNYYSNLYDNDKDHPLYFMLFKVNENVDLGEVISFEWLYENYNNTSSGRYDENSIIIESPMVTNNYMLTIGGGIMKSETIREPNNILASTKIDKIRVYDINRNEEEDYVIGIDPYTTLNELKSSFPNYNNYLKVYDRNGNVITDLNSFIGNGMILKLEKNNEVLDTLRIIVRGDLNFDGKVTYSDGDILTRYTVKALSFDKYQQLAADINRDGKINGADDLSLGNYLAGILKSLN